MTGGSPFSVRQCPRCGAANPTFTRECACGQRLETGEDDRSGNAGPSQPIATVPQPRARQVDGLSEAELRAAIGPNSDYYIASWTGARKEKGGVNWAALLFGGLWLPFRRMYGIATALWGAVLALTVLERTVPWQLGYRNAPPALDRLLGLVLGIICGVAGNGWYLRHLRKVIAAARRLGLPEEEHLRMLSRRGGTRAWRAFGFSACVVIALSVVEQALVFPVAAWLLEGVALYVPILALTFVSRRPVAAVPRWIGPAWIVAALRCLPLAQGAFRGLWTGGTQGVPLWSAATIWAILLLVPTAVLLIWLDQEHVALLLFVLLAANSILLEVLGLHLATLSWPLWTWGMPLLSLATVCVVGVQALREMATPQSAS